MGSQRTSNRKLSTSSEATQLPSFDLCCNLEMAVALNGRSDPDLACADACDWTSDIDRVPPNGGSFIRERA